jgi:cellulase
MLHIIFFLCAYFYYSFPRCSHSAIYVLKGLTTPDRNMKSLTIRALPLVLSLTTSILAHSHVDDIWAPNPAVHYKGWNPNEFDTTVYPNNTPGWYTTGQGGRPLYPISLNTYDIICNNASSPANISAPIAAGETVRVRWWEPGPWPTNHKGPVIDYIASCNGSCSDVDARNLEFVKIAQTGWIDDSIAEGFWAADRLLRDNSSWNIVIPKGLVAGEYVLRTEIIVSVLIVSQDYYKALWVC